MSLRWNGKGFLRGVPAQDLTDEQVLEYGETRLLASGCYEEVNNKEAVEEPAITTEPVENKEGE